MPITQYPNWDKLQKIINSDLYTRSGTEVGVAQGTLKLEEKGGDYWPVKITTGDIPALSWQANTDLDCNYPQLCRHAFGELPKNWLIGVYKKIYLGHFNDPAIRRNASSGGIISGSQLYLLENRKIEGAITLSMRTDKPWLAEPIIATDRPMILAGAQSKYTISPLNQILAKLPGHYQSLAYTGLPEQIAAIRKLQILKPEMVKPIKYIFGTFYGETLYFDSIMSLLRSRGIKDVTQITSLKFREGEWPGYTVIKLKSGQEIKIRKFHTNYLIPSHITKYSLYQVDYTSELADISVGDAWAPQYEQRGQGWSVVIARSQTGLNLVEELRNKNLVSLKEISEAELITMHSHGLDLKKRGAFIRLAQRKKKGLLVPNYGYEPSNIPGSRIAFEKILGILFKIFQVKITIYILEHLPPKFMGWFFMKARQIWKARTKATKRGGLTNLQFKILNNEK